MNELDLTPFKVEFDRDITNHDVREFDFVKISDGENERLFLSRPHIKYDDKYDGYDIGPDEYEGKDIWMESSELPYNPEWRTRKEKILAIYRINKFKN